jgi:hypothetical protein
MRTTKAKLYTLAAGALSVFLISVAQAYAQAVIQNPLGGGSQSLCGFIKNILNVVLAVAIPFIVLFIVYAGFLFIFARGKPAEIERAKRNFLYVIIGTFVFLGCWVLGQVVANTINAIEQGSGTAGNTSFISCN